MLSAWPIPPGWSILSMAQPPLADQCEHARLRTLVHGWYAQVGGVASGAQPRYRGSRPLRSLAGLAWIPPRRHFRIRCPPPGKAVRRRAGDSLPRPKTLCDQCLTRHNRDHDPKPAAVDRGGVCAQRFPRAGPGRRPRIKLTSCPLGFVLLRSSWWMPAPGRNAGPCRAVCRRTQDHLHRG